MSIRANWLQILVGQQAVGHSKLGPDGEGVVRGQRAGSVKPEGSQQGLGSVDPGGHDKDVFRVAWSPDGRRLATGSLDGTARVWNAASGKELLLLKGRDAQCPVHPGVRMEVLGQGS